MKTHEEQKLNRVDRYLHGDMSAEEKNVFERQLKEDPELAELLELQKELSDVLLDQEAQEFAGVLEDVYDTYSGNRKRSLWRRPVYRVTGIAATVLILLGSGYVIRERVNKLPVNRAIVAKYYRPYHVPVNYRSPEGTLDATFRKAVEQYNNKKYDEAISLFEQVLKEDTTRMDANLMNGLSNFEVHHYNKADSSFNKIIKNRDNLYLQQAQWYLGFCFLMTNQNDKAVALYRKIIAQQGYYSTKAGKILKMLESGHDKS